MFVDLVGFTPFAEERDPESVRETLDRYFETARLAVERHGGTVEKFIGDAVMAVWGTPIAHEDDAERAVRAALEIIDRVPSLGEGIEARGAVVTGEAAVTVGAEGQGMVAGDMVNTASRLQSVAPPGTLLVNETAMRSASASIAFESAGAQMLKGKLAPVEAYRALRVVANRGGQNRSEALEAPFVGRDEELRQLKELLHATSRDQRARLVSISGPAGIGKSRLAWEFEKYLDGVVETVNWHRGRSPAYGEGITFWALGEMVRRRAQLAESDDEETTRQRIKEIVADFVPDPDDQRWVEPGLLALLGVEPAPAGGRDALFAAWRIFFEKIAERATTVLLFEDLQWADSGLLDFIDHLLEWSKGKPILVVTLSRPELFERRPDWGAGHRLMTTLPLQPLSEKDMRGLLAGLVPGLPEPAVETVLHRADGIPLYAVETVRMLVSEGAVEVVDGVYRPTRDLSQLAVPETLRSLIASRLDGLEAPDRSLLQDAAVLGQRFTIPALAALSGLAADEIERRLRGMVRRELLDLEADPRSPERGQYGFVQSVIREVAYGTLARRERRSRHLSAARYFEALGDDELAGALATHYLAAHEASTEGAESETIAVQARLALRGAAERAAALGAHEQAVTYLEQALTVTTDEADRAGLLELAAESANIASQHDAAESYAREATELHVAGGRPEHAARAAALLGRMLIDSGNLIAAIEVMQEAITRVGAEDTDEGMARLLANLSRAYMRNNEASRAVQAADGALAIAEPLNLEEVVAEALINKASSLSNLGRRREAIALHEKAIEIAHQGGWIEVELRGSHNLGVVVLLDDPKRATEIFVGGAALARRLGQRSIFHWQVGTSVIWMYKLGDWDGALELVEEARAAKAAPNELARIVAVANLILLGRGDRTIDAVPGADVEQTWAAEPQIRATIEWGEAEAALIAGRLDEAHAAGLRSFQGWSGYALISAPVSIRAALWQRRPDDVREAMRVAAEDAHLAGTPIGRALLDWASAGIDAIEGRTSEALAGFRTAIEVYGQLGFRWYQALIAIDALKLLPNEPGVQQWAEDARATFERLGAKPYLALLDAALEQRAEGATRQSPAKDEKKVASTA